MAAIADKAGWQKYFKIMIKLAQTMKRATNASMAYIPCCSIVLMCYNICVYVPFVLQLLVSA